MSDKIERMETAPTDLLSSALRVVDVVRRIIDWNPPHDVGVVVSEEHVFKLLDVIADFDKEQTGKAEKHECNPAAFRSKNCTTCVHGHDRGIRIGTPVFCAPQSRVHPHSYCCTGFRAITYKELEERRMAYFGDEINEVSAYNGNSEVTK